MKKLELGGLQRLERTGDLVVALVDAEVTKVQRGWSDTSEKVLGRLG